MKEKNKTTTLNKKIIRKRIIFTIVLSFVAICCIIGMILVFVFCKKK